MMALDKKYHDELLYALRVHEISGERIGEVLAEVEAHVAETGEDPIQAFGQPREYAAQVVAQLDRRTGKLSTLDMMMSGVAILVLAVIGSTFFLDGVFDETSAIPYTLREVVGLSAVLVLGATGGLLLTRAVTAAAGTAVYAITGIGIIVLMLLSQWVISWTVDDVTPVFEMPRWLGIGLGAVLLAGAVGMVLRARRRGRVVYPKAR
ncbi:hypothetical protein MOQ72_16395 [Saccharopolyspora sp. K220]|uniref:HAAS signaling domain-containing protein n=1 Tax=Saccharopolyspora soli TaxID=2926618 RepID=UPI001F5A76C1|nr:hypothetical protein [Saccharopolyspora soli]MCI2419025.1 hypothetical protein [Saccharopolyspora soli]